MSRRFLYQSTTAAVVLALFQLGVAGSAQAADTLYACFPNDGGRVRIVDAATPCNGNEARISWKGMSRSMLKM